MTSATQSRSSIAANMTRVALVCAVYIGVSSALIRFNKHLVAPERFPYPMVLSSLHMGFSLICCFSLYLVRPSAFPGMASTEGRRAEVFRWFIPIGFTFAVSLWASNKAYFYANVTFLQFMKEGNVIIIFLISCAAGLQVMSRVRFANILWIVGFSAICVQGELHFVFLGFLVQLLSQFAECSRVVLGEFVLGGSSMKLDPLTYTLFAAPACLLFLLLGNIFAWDHEIVPRAMSLWHLLLPNASLAFALNLLVATLIQETSAVGAILTGVVKDITLVAISSFFFGETVTGQQVTCFFFVLQGVAWWSFMKVMPGHFAVRWLERAMGQPSDDEKAPLLRGKDSRLAEEAPEDLSRGEIAQKS